MIAMNEKTLPIRGLTVNQFIDTLSDNNIKYLIGSDITSVLDAIFSWKMTKNELKKVAKKLIDMNSLLANSDFRKNILSLIPNIKQKELEKRVGRNIDTSDSWSESEVNTVRDFFGIYEERLIPSPISAITEVVPNFALFEYQRQAIRKLLPLLSEDRKRAILHMPTGSGKTRTAMHIVVEFLKSNEPSVIVWLASGKELLEQASSTFQKAWKHMGNRNVQLGALWGNKNINIDEFSDGFLLIGLSKGWQLFNSDSEWTIKLAPRVSLVVFDEAHQSIAKTYRRIANELTFYPQASLLGLTATPGRTWSDIDRDGELSEFYFRNKVQLADENESPIEFLIDNEFIAKPEFRTMLTEPGTIISQKDKAEISDSLDIPNEILENLSISEQYMAAVIRSIDDLIQKGHLRILVFSASIKHAKIIAGILSAKDVECAVITGNTSVRLREQAVRNFKSDTHEPSILINFGVFTAGFDSPNTSAVVIARPTKSLVLYSQMVGRALRGPKAGGTSECEIVTVVDPSLPGFGNIAEAFHNWEDIW